MRRFYFGLTLLSLLWLTIQCGRQPTAPERKGSLALRVVFDHDAGSLPKGDTEIDQVTVTVRRFDYEQAGQVHGEGPIVLQQDLPIVVRPEGRFAEGTLKVPLEDKEYNCFMLTVEAKEKGMVIFAGSTPYPVCIREGESQTEPIEVTVRPVGAPTVKITSPANNAVLQSRLITVTGTVDDPSIKEARLILNHDTTKVRFFAVTVGLFSTEVILPGLGKHTIRVEATNLSGNTGFAEITVELVLAVRITSPPNNSTSQTRVVTVTGEVTDPTIPVARLILNGNTANPQLVAVSEGFFSNEVILSPGKNTIRVEATNEAGKTGFDEITVDFVGLAADIRVTLTWDTNGTDLDLWVTDPNQERVYFGNPVSRIGGELDADDNDGYGPENFTLVQGKAIKGIYLVQVDYFSGSMPTNARITVTLREGLATQQVSQFGPHLFQTDADSVWTVTRIQWP